MSRYIEDMTHEEILFGDRQYCYRVFYDLKFSGSDPEKAFAVIKPAFEAFKESDLYEDYSKSFYEAAETFADCHDWSISYNKINTLSEDYRVFEDFVCLYNQLEAKGEEFTIDDERFETKGLQNNITISLSNIEVERLGVDKNDHQGLKEAILSCIRESGINNGFKENIKKQKPVSKGKD